jgi:hypothetical protein
MSNGIPLAARLKQKPSAPLDFVDPDFNQAGGGDVTVFVVI